MAQKVQIDGLVQDCRNSIANALELLQSCTKPSKYTVEMKWGVRVYWLTDRSLLHILMALVISGGDDIDPSRCHVCRIQLW